ncbi:hypothetical protein VTI74DRAFT_7914 [Chaetomium olivicolor]
MSHRSSDAYSRRPTTDDRRLGDLSDRRRDGYPRGGVGCHKRNSDTSLRDRRNEPQSPRDSNVAHHAKSNVAVGVPRPENRTLSASRSPSDNPSIDKNGACEKLTSLSRKWGEALIELARLKSERHHLEEALKQRQAEYEKTMVKFADFPSIPELHNTRRTTSAAQARALDARIQKAQEEADKAAEAFMQAILSQPQAVGSESRPQPAAWTGTLQQDEALKKQHAETSELKTEISKIKAQHIIEQKNFKDDFDKQIKEADRRYKELKNETDQTVSNLRAEIRAEIRAEMKEMMKSLKKEVKVEMGEQVGLVRGEFEKWQTEQQESQKRDWQSQFSKQQQDLKKEVEEQLSAYRDSSDAVCQADVLALIETQNLALRRDISGLLRRVDEHARLLAQRTSLTNSAQQTEALGRLTQLAEEHSAKLERLDVEVLDKAADILSCDFPKLQKTVTIIQTQVDNVSGDVDRKHAALTTQIQTYVQGMGMNLGRLVDEMQGTVQDHATRIQALEASPAASGPPNSTTQGHTAAIELDSINSDMASLKSDFGSTKVEIDRLDRKYAALSELVSRANHTATTSAEDLGGQLDLLRHSLDVLSTQYNNLSTRSLAEHILAQLETVSPSARQVAADIDCLKKMIEGIAARVDSVEGWVQNFKVGKVDGRFGDTAGVDLQGRIIGNGEAYRSNGVGHKRKRTGSEDPNVNGNGGQRYPSLGVNGADQCLPALR